MTTTPAGVTTTIGEETRSCCGPPGPDCQAANVAEPAELAWAAS